MARILAILMTLLVATVIAAPQGTVCPQIYIDVPIGTGQAGEPYSVRIEPSQNLPALSYLWSVTTHRGEVGMVRGQGTETIYVPWREDDVTVTIKVTGLPAGCPETASASAIYDPSPVAEKLDEFVGSLSKVKKTRFDAVREAAIQNPTAQLYITIGGKRGNVAKSIKSKRSELNSLLLNRLGRGGQKPMIVDSARSDDRVIIWLLPAGAEHPKP